MIPALTPIKSSNIHGYHYDGHSLTLKFNSGGVHRFDGVPPDRVNGMLNNGSAGTYFHKFIKGKYPSMKIEETGS